MNKYDTTFARASVALVSALALCFVVPFLWAQTNTWAALGALGVSEWFRMSIEHSMGAIDLILSSTIAVLVWAILHRYGQKDWKGAAVVGAVCSYAIPKLIAVAYVYRLVQAYGLSILVVLAPNWKVIIAGALIALAAWRIAYRKQNSARTAEAFA